MTTRAGTSYQPESIIELTQLIKSFRDEFRSRNLKAAQTTARPTPVEAPGFDEPLDPIKFLVKLNEKFCRVQIDSGSSINAISHKTITRTGLEVFPLLRPYYVSWLDSTSLTITERCKVPLTIAGTQNDVWCDVISMDVGSIILGRPWLDDFNATINRKSKTCIFFNEGKRYRINHLEPRTKTSSSQETRTPEHTPVARPPLFSAKWLDLEDRIQSALDAMVAKPQIPETQVVVPPEVRPLITEIQSIVPEDFLEELPPVRDIKDSIDLVPDITLPHLPYFSPEVQSLPTAIQLDYPGDPLDELSPSRDLLDVIDMVPDTTLPCLPHFPQFSPEVQPLLTGSQPIFTEDLQDELPSHWDKLHTIDLVPGVPLPLLPLYRLHSIEHCKLQRQVDELLLKGFIKKSLSPYTVPALFISEKDNMIKAPILRITEFSTSLDVMGDALGLGVQELLNLGEHSNTYYIEEPNDSQLRPSSYDRKFYAVAHRLRHLQHNRLPHDLILYSHLESLRFLNSQRKLTSRICAFLNDPVLPLGFSLSIEGVSPDYDKGRAIVEWRPPWDDLTM